MLTTTTLPHTEVTAKESGVRSAVELEDVDPPHYGSRRGDILVPLTRVNRGGDAEYLVGASGVIHQLHQARGRDLPEEVLDQHHLLIVIAVEPRIPGRVEAIDRVDVMTTISLVDVPDLPRVLLTVDHLNLHEYYYDISGSLSLGDDNGYQVGFMGGPAGIRHDAMPGLGWWVGEVQIYREPGYDGISGGGR